MALLDGPTWGEMYEASILNFEPMAPSMAHPGQDQRALTGQHSGDTLHQRADPLKLPKRKSSHAPRTEKGRGDGGGSAVMKTKAHTDAVVGQARLKRRMFSIVLGSIRWVLKATALGEPQLFYISIGKCPRRCI